MLALGRERAWRSPGEGCPEYMGVQRLLTENKCPQAQVDGIAKLGTQIASRNGMKSFLDLHCPVSKIELQITRIKRPIK